MHDAERKQGEDRVEARLEALEIKSSYADDTLEELNRVLFAQQQQIDRLLRDVAHLRSLIPEGTQAVQRNLRDELPPHY